MSGLWLRMQEIFNANGHAALDQLENPIKMSQQLMRDLDQDLHQLRQRLVVTLARGKTLRAERSQLAARGSTAQHLATQAVVAGDDAAARRQLEIQLRAERDAALLAEPLREAEAALSALRGERDALLRERDELASQARLIQLGSQPDDLAEDLYSRSLRRRERMAGFADQWRHGSRSVMAAQELRDEELGTAASGASDQVEIALQALKAELGSTQVQP